MLAFLVCPALLRSQQDDDVIRTNTDLVVLNVTVTDKAGQYVPGLKLTDFTIFEDGRQVLPEGISSFSVHESPFASVVLLDTSGSMDSRLSLARSAAIRFLDRLREEDVAAEVARRGAARDAVAGRRPKRRDGGGARRAVQHERPGPVDPDGQ